jgi:hypothetical protein
MAIVRIVPGPCGMQTRIQAEADEGYQVTFTIASDCEHIQKLAAELGEVSALEELRCPMTQTTPYQLADRFFLHASCPVPSAMVKAMEVAAGMALPADVHILAQQD